MAKRWVGKGLEYPRRADEQRETKLERLSRHINRERMLKFRSVPVKRRLWWVELTATQVGEGEFKRGELAAGLTFGPQGFWCWSRRKAKRLVGLDVAAGGSGSFYAVECRLCAVCGRILLGPEANEYRGKQMRAKRSWQYPQGPACNLDCKPRGRGENGESVRYRQRGEAA